MIEDILGRPFWRRGMPTLFDHRKLDMSGASYAAMKRAAENHLRHAERIGGGRVAILMGSAAAFANARQYEMLLEGQSRSAIQVFMDLDAALAWVAASALVW